MAINLHGYHLSVYTRIARLALIEKQVPFQMTGINPFDPDQADALLQLSPFGRVPIMVHDGFRLFETLAITQYVDNAFDGPDLVPSDAQACARMFQVISVINSYAFEPLVLQVFSHRVMHPMFGQPVDEVMIADGLKRAGPVLAVLDDFCDEALALNAATPTLADLFTAPVIDYFSRTTEGSRALAQFPHLANWWATVSQRASVAQTNPELATPGPKE